jgi:hypothetical protein
MEVYKLIYEKDGKFYGSKTGVPAKDDHEFAITREEIESYGLVYSVKGEVKYSTDALPSADDVSAADYEAAAKTEQDTTVPGDEVVDTPEIEVPTEEEGSFEDETNEPDEVPEVEDEE